MKNIRKIVALLAAALMLFSVMPLSAFAATGINANEQAVLDKLSTSAVIGGNGWSFTIPQEYVNSAKNYFAGDCDMTEEEKTTILSYIDTGMAVIKEEADSQKFAGKEYSLSKMGEEARSKVLSLGQSACAEVDLSLTYIPTSNQVVVTPIGSNTPVFESAPVIKTTGQDFALTAGLIAVAVVAVMALGSAVMFGVSKKNGLLV